MATKLGFSTGKGFIEKVDKAAQSDDATNATKATKDENEVNIAGNYMRLIPLATPDPYYQDYPDTGGSFWYNLNSSVSENDLVFVRGSVNMGGTYNQVFFIVHKDTVEESRQVFYKTITTSGVSSGFYEVAMMVTTADKLAVSIDKLDGTNTTKAAACKFRLDGCYKIVNADK
jgi:hypothetical protein